MMAFLPYHVSLRVGMHAFQMVQEGFSLASLLTAFNMQHVAMYISTKLKQFWTTLPILQGPCSWWLCVSVDMHSQGERTTGP